MQRRLELRLSDEVLDSWRFRARSAKEPEKVMQLLILMAAQEVAQEYIKELENGGTIAQEDIQFVRQWAASLNQEENQRSTRGSSSSSSSSTGDPTPVPAQSAGVWGCVKSWWA